MARKASPNYWKARNQWIVTINGQRHVLGVHPEDAAKPVKSKRTGLWNVPEKIMDAFNRIQRDKPVVSGDAVAVVLDSFLTWCEENRAKRTYERYKDFLQSFADSYGTYSVEELHAGHVTAWLKDKGWNSTTKRNAITAVQRALNWGVKNHGLLRNPIRGMEKPAAKTRTDILTPKEFEKLLKAIPDQAFRDLLVVSYDTGARPQEIKGLEKRHLDIPKQRAVIPADEAKGKITRTVYFPTERCMEVLNRLAKENPTGPMFLNNRGNKWTGYAVKNRMEDLESVVGRRITHYSLRHSFITRKLIAGVDSHVVASLAGHRDTTMVHKVYSAVAQDHAFMLENARRGA